MTRAPRRVVATLIAVLAVLAAVASPVDALVFGPHDHVAAATNTGTADTITSTGDTTSQMPHHCELSINPAERVTRVALPLPLPLSETLAEPILLSAYDTPFGLFPPPRA